MRERLFRWAERWLWLAWGTLLLLIGLTVLTLAQELEQSLRPVVARFDVLSIKRQSDGALTVSGTLDKVRDCRLVSLRAMGDNGHALTMVHLDRAPGVPMYSRPTGPATWGPWRIEPAGARYITLMAEHECHALWTVRSTLASFQTTPRYEP